MLRSESQVLMDVTLETPSWAHAQVHSSSSNRLVHTEKMVKAATECTNAIQWRSLTCQSNNPMVTRLRDALATNNTRIIDLLRHWDRDMDGKISKGEFSRALKSSQEHFVG